MNKPLERTTAIVIGSGLSGLAAARELAQRGIAVTILDAADRVADPWRARHPQLRLNIHRHFAHLPGLPMSRRDGIFVRRDTVVDYLERYAAGLAVPIHFGAEVTRLEKTGDDWLVATATRDFACAHVIIATGRDRVPYIPDWPGRDTFSGELLHAASVGDLARFDGRRVLVVGAGNSGSDVLNHLARQRPAEVRVAVRHGPAVVPTRVFGFPLHRLARVFAALPAGMLDGAFRLTQRLFLGDLARYGLNSHPDGGGTRLVRDGIAFAIDDGFVAALRKGRFSVVGEVLGFERESVILGNGDRWAPDVVICATGYRAGLEGLLDGLGVLGHHGQPHHPQGEADARHPGLWFSGFRPTFTGYFDAASIAARRIANGIEASACAVPTVAPGNAPRGPESADARAAAL